MQFRNRVGKAMRRGDKDAIDDAATPFVNQAAVEARKHLDNLKRNAEEVRCLMSLQMTLAKSEGI